MKKLIVTAATLALIVAGTSTIAYGGKGNCKGKKIGSDERITLMKHVLDLSDEQVAQVREIKATRITQARDAFGQERQRIRDLDPSSSEYEEAVAEHAKARAEKVEAKIVDRGQMRAEIFAILTPEQQEKFKEFRAETRKLRKQ